MKSCGRCRNRHHTYLEKQSRQIRKNEVIILIYSATFSYLENILDLQYCKCTIVCFVLQCKLIKCSSKKLLLHNMQELMIICSFVMCAG